MIEPNTIQHFLSPSGIRLTAADTTEAVRTACRIHHMRPLSASVLGKAMTAAAILANDFKNHEGVSLKMLTDGPSGPVYADAYEGRYLRGYTEHPEAGAACPDDEKGIITGAGQLIVTRYSLLRQPYTSAVNLWPGDVSDVISAYLNLSEQVLSAVRLEVLFDGKGKVVHAGGIMAQLMPEGDREKMASLFRKTEEWQIFHPEKSKDPGQAEFESLWKKEFIPLYQSPVSFRCTCSLEHIRHNLSLLPAPEKESLLKDSSIEIVCHYCGRKYEISRETLNQWFHEQRKGDVS